MLTESDESAKDKDIPEGRAKGGKRRAEKLSEEERKAIGRKGAQARWDSNADLPFAVCSSENRPLRLAGAELDAYVLEDGTRVISMAGLLRAFKRHPRAATRSQTLPPMLQSATLEPFITDELLESCKTIQFRVPSGIRATGYRAEALPQICEVYLKARDAGALSSNQKVIAVQAEVLLRAFATVGIIALVDEATGFQEYRSRTALADILEAFVAKELQPWVRTFPSEFYTQIFRLRKLEQGAGVKRPQWFGTITNDIVYQRLAPGVLDELKRVTVRDEAGRPKHRYFQRLTQNVGYPQLREHLGAVVAMMRMSKDWHSFMDRLDEFYPKLGSTLKLPLDYRREDDTGEGL
jgi:hypothetical protein